MTEEPPDVGTDAFFIGESVRVLEELKQIVAAINSTLAMDTEIAVSGFQSIYYLGLGQNLMDAAKLASTIAGYLLPLEEVPGPPAPVVLEEPPAVVKRKPAPVRIPWSDLPQ